MANDKYWNGEVTLNTDWGGDESTEFKPLSGGTVQKLLKDTLNSKVGYVDYCETTKNYVLTKDKESFLMYNELISTNPEEAEKYKIGEFKAPAANIITVNVVNPENGYLSVLQGTKGVVLTFNATTKNAEDQSPVDESYTYKITSTQSDGSQKSMNGVIMLGAKDTTVNIDSLLTTGQNNITITVNGQQTEVTGFKTVIVKVIMLNVKDTFNIATVYNFDNTNNLEINVPHEVTTNAKTVVRWFIDYEEKGTTNFNASGNGTFRYSLKKGELTNGVHSLIFFGEYDDATTAEPFRTPIYYRNFFVMDNTYEGNLPLFSLSFEVPYDNAFIEEKKYPSFYNVKEYDSLTLPFAVYSTQQEVPVDIMASENGEAYMVLTNVNAQPGEVLNQKISVSNEGTLSIKLVSGEVTTPVIGPFDVANNETIEEPSTEELVLDLSAVNRNNNMSGYDEWVSSVGYIDASGNVVEHKAIFNNFAWNTNNGWNNDKLLITNGTSVEIPFAPFGNASLFNNGFTFEIEFSTKNIYNEDGEVCRIMDKNGSAGIVLTASEAIFNVDADRKISTKFKSGNTYRIAFVKTPTGQNESEYKNSRFVKIYVNGILCGLEEFDFSTNFINQSTIKIQGTKDAEVELSYIRIYRRNLSDDEILNNYMFFRTDVNEKTALYTRNNIYNINSEIDKEILQQQLPVMVFYQIEDSLGQSAGKIEDLELEFSDKGKTIHMDIDYTNVQNPEFSFYWKNAGVRPQGTSSMKYPKKNYRIYTQRDSENVNLGATEVYIGEEKTKYLNGTITEPTLTKKKRKYSFKKGAAPVKCWCLKADFAESSGTHNTGTAKYWNSVMINGGLKTKAQQIANDNKYEYDVRTTVDGFPIALFYKPLVGEMRFLGKYNFNNDKSTEDVFGFTGGDELEREFRYVPIGYNKPVIQKEDGEPLAEISNSYLDFSNPNEDSPLYYEEEQEDGRMLYYRLQTPEMFDNPRMECWEILSSGSKLALFQQKMTGNEALDLDGDKEKIGYFDNTGAFQESFESRFPDCAETYHTYNLQRFIDWMVDCMFLKVEIVNGEGKLVPMSDEELKTALGTEYKSEITIGLKTKRDGTFKFTFGSNTNYQKVSFGDIESDLNTPETDIDGNEKPIESYRSIDITDERASEFIVKEELEIPTEKIDGVDLVKVGGYYYYWGYTKVYYCDVVPTSEIFGYSYVWSLSDNEYYIWKDFEYFKDYFTTKTYPNTSYYRALKFAVEKYDHFDLEKMAAYYIYLMRFGGVDQTVKNAMLTTEGSDDNNNLDLPSKWYFINYDNDTILGVKNDGRLVFDPYMTRNTIEKGTEDAYCYAGRNSTMWNNFEFDTDFMELVPVIDGQLQTTNGLSYDNAIKMYNQEQAGTWCERVYNWDAKVKYIDTYTNRSKDMEDAAEGGDASFDYLLNIQGPRSAHREWWLAKRFNIFDSYYTTGSFKSDVVTFKCNGPSKQDDTAVITSGEDVYYGYYKNNPTSAYKTPTTIKPGDSWELTVTADSTIGDPHAIFGSPNIEEMDLRGIAYRLTELQMNGIRNNKIGTKLKKLIIGDTNNPKINNVFSVFGSVNSMEKLEVLDVTGCAGLTLNAELKNLKELYAAGTATKTIAFNSGGNIEKLELPIGLVSLTLNETLNITWDNIKFYDIIGNTTAAIKEEVSDFSKQQSLSKIEIKNSPQLLNDHNMILKWLEGRKNSGLDNNACELYLDSIDWHISEEEIDRLLILSEVGTAINVNGVRDTIKGKIVIDKKLTLDEITVLTSIFGNGCFKKGASLEIVAHSGVYIAKKNGGGHTILEGDVANEYEIIMVNINDDNPDYILSMSETNDKGFVSAVGSGIVSSFNNKTLVYRVEVDELKRVVSKLRISLTVEAEIDEDLQQFNAEPYDINVIKRTYPTIAEIDGRNPISSTIEREYKLLLTDANGNTDFNGNYRTVWTLSGNAIGTGSITDIKEGKPWVTIINQSNLQCVIQANNLMNSSFAITATVYKTLEGSEVKVLSTTKNIGLKNNDILLVPEENPALFKLLNDNGFTDDATKLTKERVKQITLDYAPKRKQFKDIFMGYEGYSSTGSSTKDVKFTDFSIFKEFPLIQNIPAAMFSGCTNLQTIDLPTAISAIEADAFRGCSSLKNITLPTNLVTIGNNAFNGVKGFTEFTIPNSVTNIGTFAFKDADNLTKITLGTGITTISEGMFEDCGNLKEVVFNGDVTVIGKKAFALCPKLVKLTLSENLSSIVFDEETNPFMGCYALSFEGGNSKYEVVNGTLYYNDTVNNKKWILKQNRNVAINSTDKLYVAAYGLCGMNQANLVLTSNLVFAGTNALNGSRGTTLTMTTHFNTHEVYSEIFSSTKYTTYKFVDGETIIPTMCFKDSSEITTVAIPETIKEIGNEAFLNCNGITTITIPSSVERIGNRVFSYMNKLQTVVFKPTVPPTRTLLNGNRDIIWEVGNVTFSVNGDSLEEYETAWEDYKEFIEVMTLPSHGYFRIIENGEIYYSSYNFGEVVSDVVIGNNISVIQNSNGYYEFDNPTQANTNLIIKRNGVSIGKYSSDYCTIYLGDNMSLYTGNGIDFTKGIVSWDYLTKNGIASIVSGRAWAYDSKVQGLKSGKSYSSASNKSIVRFNLSKYAENGYVYMTLGQVSEKGYDYLHVSGDTGEKLEFEIVDIKNQVIDTNKMTTLSGICSNYIKIKLPVMDFYDFEYLKDGSRDLFIDAVWIQTIGKPVYNEPEINTDYTVSFNIKVTTPNLPSDTQIRITNGSYFNVYYSLNENGEVAVSLPKNETFTISAEDFMVGNKHYMAFDERTVNTSMSVSDMELSYDTLMGQSVLLSTNEIIPYNMWDGVSGVNAYIFSDDENDYYVYPQTTSSVWSNKIVSGEENFYVEAYEGVTDEYTNGYENTLSLSNLMGSDAAAVQQTKTAQTFGGIVEWYLPSLVELTNVYQNFSVIFPGKVLWTSNIKDNTNAWVLGINGETDAKPRSETQNIMIFGRRKL